MACAPEETQSPELLALEKNSCNLCRGITSISTVTDFALLLVEKSFITSNASSSILRTMGVTEQEKCDRLLGAVREQVRTDRGKFESFVGILRQEPALTCYTDVLINSRDVEGQKRYISTNSHNSSAPSSPGQSRDVICQPVMEFGKTMSDLTEILQRADHALKRMLVAFENMAHYMKNRKYIAIVQSKAYEAVDSVRALFRLLAPHWKPVDCSLLKALVHAAGVEAATKRLDEYLHMSNSFLLGSGSEKVYAPCEVDTLSQNDSDTHLDMTSHDSTSEEIDSQPVTDSTVPVTTVIEAEEMSWGAFRCIQSLLCGVFGVPSCALQYDANESGSVVVTCVTSMEMLSHIRSTLLDDGDMQLLLREKIVSIQVGKDYTAIVGTQDYWMVPSTDKEEESNAHLLPFIEDVCPTDEQEEPTAHLLPHIEGASSITTLQPVNIHINLSGQFGFQKVHIHTSKVLGTGAYGSVFRATLDHLPCAAKILHTVFFQPYDSATVNFASRFERECHILKDLHHPHIVQFLGIVQDPNKHGPVLLMELMKESLTDFLKRSKMTLPFNVQMNITHDIALALDYLHSKYILHRDLSSSNVLLNDSCRAKVTDFGMSKVVDANPQMSRSKVTQCPGTPAYMPPEALRAKPRYSKKLDTFSLGVLIIQIITRTFPAPTDAEIVVEAPLSPTGEIIVPVPELERRKKDIDKVPSDHALLPIAYQCLKDRDKERPTATQVCQSLEQLRVGKPYKTNVTEASFEEKVTDVAPLQEEKQQQKSTSHKDTSSVSKVEDEEALYDAADRGDVSVVRQLIARHVDVNCKSYETGWTPLMKASRKGHVGIVRILIEAKAQVNTQEEHGRTALYLAVEGDKVDVVRLLIEAEADVDTQTEAGWTALIIASLEGYETDIKRLLQKHSDVSISEMNGRTPLMTASFEGHVDIVRILIKAKAQVNIQDEAGWTALHLAAQEGKVNVMRLLIEAEAQLDIETGDGRTALYIASGKGHIEVVQLLLQNHVDVSICEMDGRTPLMTASFEGHVDIVRILINADAEIDTQDEAGWTALHLAAQENKVDVVRQLTESKAEVNIQTEDGSTALYIASEKGHVSVVQLLLQKHADISISETNGRTPLMTASFEGHVDIVRILIEAKAQVNTIDETGWTALHLAAQEDKVDVVSLLTEAEAQVDIQTVDGRTALYVASGKGHVEVVQLLLQNHADVKISTTDGTSSLFIASQEGHCDVVDLLLRNGANINQLRHQSGFTPLHAASGKGHSDVVKTLIQNGADINLVSKRGKRAIDQARYEGQAHIVRMLKEAENS